MFHARQSERIKVKKIEMFCNLLKISQFCVQNGHFFQNYKNMGTDIKR